VTLRLRRHGGADAIDTVVSIPLGATGFNQSGSNAGLMGLDAIGLGADGSSHADALAMIQLANPRSICGGASPLAGGEYHTLAVNSDGTVSAWGNNTYGQLGNGTPPAPPRWCRFTACQG
jgi:hypothetical protein